MRSKKVQSKNMRKHRNKKSKKCNCGLKLPFLKWGGDSPTAGPTGKSKTDLGEKLSGLLSATTTKLTGDLNELTTASKNAINNVTDSTKSVIDDTSNQVTKNTKEVLDKTQNDAKNATNKTSGFLTSVFENAKNSLHEITKPKTTTTNRGSFPSKPVTMPPKSTNSTTSSLSYSSSKTNKTASVSSNKSMQKSNSDKYVEKTIAKYRKLLNSPRTKQGGRRRSFKKSKPKNPRNSGNSKKTKRRHMYKHKGGSTLCMTGEPLGIEKSPLAFTASPISNINAVGPRPDQIYGQTPFPARTFYNE
jgi:hypothetical protein